MQTNIERSKMTKIRMNTELRNKLFNKIKHTFENEDTQEREAFLQAGKMLIDNMNTHIDLQLMLLKEHIHQKMFLFLELSKRNMEVLVML